MKIKSFKEFINERKINENIESIDFNSIADQISIGETSGDTPCQWELEVSLRDWTNIDDEDIDYICDQIREGVTSGSDPIDWSLDLTCEDDNIIEEEEEEISDEDAFDEAEYLNGDDEKYKSDEDIEASYDNYIIREFHISYTKSSGFIDLEFPNGEDKCDHWIIYSNGKIAFEHWYPEKIYDELVSFIKSKLNNEEKNNIIKKFENFNRSHIANQLDMDESEFEDSSDLGDMIDRLSDENDNYESAYLDAEMLFDAFKMSDTGKYLSGVFTDTISPEMNYNKTNKIFNDVIKYYPEFKEEYGYLEEFNTNLFNMSLKDIIKDYLRKGGIKESKSNKKDYVGKIKDRKIYYSSKYNKKDKDRFLICRDGNQEYDTEYLIDAIKQCINLKDLTDKEIKKWIAISKEFDPVSVEDLEKLIKKED